MEKVPKALKLVTAVLAAAVIVFLATAPPSPKASITHGRPRSATTVRGAFHIHTTRSDGALDKASIADAAARAGLQFAIFSDHGDGTRVPDPPEYLHGVLCVDGVEISTNAGHYVAVGMPASPYPLGGEPDTVVEDVARLGGFGVAAHPFSPRAELSWLDWNAPVDGLEWLSADSAWRDEGRPRLTRALIDYLWSPAGAMASLLDRPDDVLAKWDALATSRPVVALAAHDAHGGLGEEVDGRPGRRLHVPSYEATFRTFAVYANLARPLAGNAVADADELLRAIRRGRVFTAVDAVASGASLEFSASAGGRTVESGEELPVALGPASFRIRTSGPADATTLLLRNGRSVAEGRGGALEHQSPLPGVYRVEVHVPGAPGDPPVPWLLSNPITRPEPSRASGGLPVAPDQDATSPVALLPLTAASWHVEASPESSGSVTTDPQGVTLTYRLKAGDRASQFVALAADLRQVPADADVIVFDGQASLPMRISTQLRFDASGGVRWRKSVYLDATRRRLEVPLDGMRPADGERRRPPAATATTLLFVVDLTNTRPGAQGSFTLANVGMGRRAAGR